jgi:hypothetical protein
MIDPVDRYGDGTVVTSKMGTKDFKEGENVYKRDCEDTTKASNCFAFMMLKVMLMNVLM